MSEKLVEQWQRDWLRQSEYSAIPLYRISPDNALFLGDWVCENARSDVEGMEGGYGSVLWLRKGKVIRFIRYAAKTGAENLSLITEEVFKN